MFICRGCAANKEAFDLGMFKSKGPCENCGYTDICIDIHHSSPLSDIDPNWEQNLADDLARLKERNVAI